MLRLLVVIAIAGAVVGQTYRNGQYKYCLKWERLDNSCRFTGYAPGGNVTEIGNIQVPEITLQKDALQTVMTRTSEALAVAGLIVSVVAPFMAPVVAVFATATAILGSEATPTADDIINAVNDKMEDLTYAQNEKLERMKGYVDAQIIGLHKDLLTDHYMAMWKGWLMCMDLTNKEESDECQRTQFLHIYSNKVRFTKYEVELRTGRELSNAQHRELEAKLPSTRDYATLLLMVLKALVNRYEKEKEGLGPANYKWYAGKMSDAASMFVEYTTKSVAAINEYHKGTEDMGECVNTLTCRGIEHVYGGYNGRAAFGGESHTAQATTCDCTIDEGTVAKCKIKTSVHFNYDACDDNYEDWHFRAKPTGQSIGSIAAMSAWHAPTIVKDRARDYIVSESKIIEEYWNKNLLNFIEPWKAAIEYAKEGKETEVDEKKMKELRKKEKSSTRGKKLRNSRSI